MNPDNPEKLHRRIRELERVLEDRRRKVCELRDILIASGWAFDWEEEPLWLRPEAR